MLLTIFSSFYELVCGVNTESPEYNDNGVYDSVGLITLILAILFAFLFYTLLGRWKPVFHQLKHWVLSTFLIALMGFFLAFVSGKKETGAVDGYLIRFAIINTVWIAFLFFLASLALKRTSIFAKRTPF